MDTARTLHTIGHSNHSLEKFLALLDRHGIRCLVDVRGQPYSRFNPHFNRVRLATALAAAGMEYRWEGTHLSGRPTDPEMLAIDGKPDWTRVMASPGFNATLDVVVAGAATRTVLMCAEEDPRRCHRRFLLTPPLLARGVGVRHVRGDGRVEDEADIAQAEAPPQGDLFRA
jgi:uncharacterized protein (DUF488 family)